MKRAAVNRCRVTATACAIALLGSDIQKASAFTLQLPPIKAASSQRGNHQGLGWTPGKEGVAKGARGTIVRKKCSSGICRVAWGWRRERTTLRMGSEENLSSQPGGMAGATAPEPDPREGRFSDLSSRDGLVDVEEGRAGEFRGEEASVDEKSEKLRLTAEKLKLQAEKLRLEVERQQLMLQASRLQDKEALEIKQDKLISELRKLRVKDEELTAMVRENIRKVNAELFMRLADIAETAADPEERDNLVALSEDVMRAVDRVDKTRAVKISKGIKESLDRAEEIERARRARAAAQALIQATNATYGSPNSALPFPKGQSQANLTGSGSLLDMDLSPSARIQDLRTLAGMGVTDNSSTSPMPDVMNVMFLPLWVPTSLLKFVGSAPALLDADTETVKTQILGMDTFYVTGMEKSPFAALYRGNMRGQDSEEVFEKVTAKLESTPGLRDRVQMFLMTDPTPLTPDEVMQARNRQRDPVFMLVSKEAMPPKSTLLSAAGALVTLAGTAFTGLAYGIGNFASRPELLQRINEGDTSVAGLAFPIMAGVLALQVVHELGHWIAAKSNGVKMGAPIFIPSLQLGVFGAITPILSFPKNRKQYFDIAASGPVLGTVVSLAAFIVGVVMTTGASPEALSSFPLVPVGLFHSSFLVGAMTTIALPMIMSQAVTSTVAIHPLAIVGITGLIVNALNLMPIGSLDGGRIAMSAFGRKFGGILGTVTLLLQAISAVFNNYSLQLFWGLLVIIFQRGQDVPAKDELTGVDDTRMLTTILLLLFSLITLIPFPEVGS